MTKKKHHDHLSVMGRVNRILESSMNQDDRFIRDYEELRVVIEVLRAMGKKIVMTKGVFDMLHVGHSRYIADAKGHGDILVVSVDTDELTKLRKGPRRPVVEESERIEMLLHLRYVDIIILRTGTPDEDEEDIAVVRPDILITSESTKDYTAEKKGMLESKYNVEIRTLAPRAQTSTTARIRTLMIDGAEELSQTVQQAVAEYLERIKA